MLYPILIGLGVLICAMLLFVLYRMRSFGHAPAAATPDQELLELTAKLAASESTQEHLTTQLEEKTQALTQLQDDIAQLQKQQTSLQSDLARMSSLQSTQEHQLEEKSNALKTAQEDLASMTEERNTLKAEVETLNVRYKNASDNLQETKDKLDQLNTKLEELQNNNLTLEKKQEQLLSQNKILNELREADEERFRKSSDELEKKLTTLSENFLNKSAQDFQESNSKHMSSVINPLQRELESFRTLLNETQKNQAEHAGQLHADLQNMQRSQQNLSTQANALALALKQGGKSQGMWGEHQLELCLESSGLVQGKSYLREVTDVNEDNREGRVDAVVLLPKNHCILIDAKCSLTAYTDYVNYDAQRNESEGLVYEDSQQLKEDFNHWQQLRQEALKRHIDSLRKHINELSVKNYQTFTHLNSPSFVFMFVPVDNALTLALQKDSKLYADAQQKNIYLVSPSTLLPALQVVSNLWIMASQQQKIQGLVSAANKIYNKSRIAMSHFETLLRAKRSLDDNLAKFSTSFTSGNGSLTKQLENFNNQQEFNQNKLDATLQLGESEESNDTTKEEV